MGWIKNKIRNWLSSPDSIRYNNTAQNQLVSTTADRDLYSEPTMQFVIYSAIGGKIIEFRSYSKSINHDDQTKSSLYVIGKDEDFAEKISKIIVLESMKD